MRTNIFLTSAFLLIMGIATPAQTADEIIAKNFAVTGIDNLAKVNSIIISGKITASSLKGNPIGYLVKKLRPFRQYMELNNNGDISTTMFDGRSEWATVKGKTVKNPFDVEEQRKRKICFEGELFYFKNNGYNFEYIGKVQFNGLDFFAIKVTGKDAFEAVYYIDPESTLLMAQREGDVETFYSGFKNVNGVILPHSIKVTSLSTEQTSELNIDSIELNKEVEESLFVK